jgi:pterin-4a-carbinolamine dehydratase
MTLADAYPDWRHADIGLVRELHFCGSAQAADFVRLLPLHALAWNRRLEVDVSGRQVRLCIHTFHRTGIPLAAVRVMAMVDDALARCPKSAR